MMNNRAPATIVSPSWTARWVTTPAMGVCNDNLPRLTSNIAASAFAWATCASATAVV